MHKSSRRTGKNDDLTLLPCRRDGSAHRGGREAESNHHSYLYAWTIYACWQCKRREILGYQ